MAVTTAAAIVFTLVIIVPAPSLAVLFTAAATVVLIPASALRLAASARCTGLGFMMRLMGFEAVTFRFMGLGVLAAAMDTGATGRAVLDYLMHGLRWLRCMVRGC